MPKTKTKKNTHYFNEDTEKAIIQYNNSDDYDFKSKIYESRIHPAFFKLTENLIHTFKFYYTEVDNLEDLQHEVIIFLLSKIHKFNPNNGAKAYSYFGTIAKRYLILSNQKIYKKRIDSFPISSIEEDDKFSYDLEEKNTNDKLSFFIDEYINYFTTNIFKFFPKEIDAKIADAILEVFRKRETIDIFNKKALYLYIKEIVNAKTPKITKIADQMYDVFKEKYLFYIENGYINF